MPRPITPDNPFDRFTSFTDPHGQEAALRASEAMLALAKQPPPSLASRLANRPADLPGRVAQAPMPGIHKQEMFVYPDGSSVQMRYRDGVPHGQCTAIKRDGSHTVFQFENGRRLPVGTRVDAEGNCYAGSLKHFQRHGQGRQDFIDGAACAGTFVDDKLQGFGAYRFADGGHYAGMFHRGQAHGPGRYFAQDGKRFDAVFVHDRLVMAEAPPARNKRKAPDGDIAAQSAPRRKR